jgi:hypothetical protein
VVEAFMNAHTEASRPDILHGWIKALQAKFEASRTG